MQGFQAAKLQPAGKRAGYRAELLIERAADLFHKYKFAHDDAADDVAVAVDILGGTVYNKSMPYSMGRTRNGDVNVLVDDRSNAILFRPARKLREVATRMVGLEMVSAYTTLVLGRFAAESVAGDRSSTNVTSILNSSILLVNIHSAAIIVL
jgi:hypothetical protein